MKIGVISDTHGMLRPAVQDVFRGVDRIIHCGDVGSVRILDQLALIAPTSAAYGNTDGFDVRARCKKVVRLDCDGLTVIALHGDQFGLPFPGVLREEFPDADVVLFGHTHQPLVDHTGGKVVVMNPGAAGAVRCTCKPSVGILELGDHAQPDARIVSLDPTR